MCALFSQKRWFKSRKDNDRDEDKRKNRIQAWTRITLVLIVKIYLQFLFTIFSENNFDRTRSYSNREINKYR